MDRETDAHAQCLRAYGELQQARVVALRASVRLRESGGKPIEVPEYEAVPAAAPAERYQSLASYFGEEALRLTRVATASTSALDALSADRPLAPAPRRVPATYVLAEHVRGYWVVIRWLLFPPITIAFGLGLFGLSRLQPWASLAPLGLLAGYAIVRGVGRVRMLRVASPVEIVSRSYAPGMGNSQNWPRQVAHGWNVRVIAYTGSSYRTTVTYRGADAQHAKLVVGGPKYEGVVLVDPATRRARPVTAFGSAPRPDDTTQWDPQLPTRVWLWMAASLVFVAAWVTAAVVVARGLR